MKRGLAIAPAIRPLPRVAALMLTLGLALSGCGLKGALYLPEKSGDITIRPGPGSTAPPVSSSTPPASPEAPASSSDPTTSDPAGEPDAGQPRTPASGSPAGTPPASPPSTQEPPPGLSK